MHVDAGGGLVGELALEGGVDAAGEVDGLAAAGDLSEGVAVGLAALAHDGVGDFVLVLDDELAELEHDVDALGQGGAAPFLLCLAGDFDDAVEAVLVGEGELVDDLAGGGVFDADGLVRVSDVLFAVDPQVDCHWFYLSSHSSTNGGTTLLGQTVACFCDECLDIRNTGTYQDTIVPSIGHKPHAPRTRPWPGLPHRTLPAHASSPSTKKGGDPGTHPGPPTPARRRVTGSGAAACGRAGSPRRRAAWTPALRPARRPRPTRRIRAGWGPSGRSRCGSWLRDPRRRPPCRPP